MVKTYTYIVTLAYTAKIKETCKVVRDYTHMQLSFAFFRGLMMPVTSIANAEAS